MSQVTLPDTAWCLTCDVPVTFAYGKWRHEDGSLASLHDVGRPPVASDEARRVGAKALITVGTLVWSSDRRNRRDEGIGGVVVSIDEGGTVDPETGEVRGRTFLCVDPETLVMRRLAEREVFADGIELPYEGRLRKVWRRLAADVGTCKGPGLPREVDRLRWAHELAVLGVLGGRS